MKEIGWTIVGFLAFLAVIAFFVAMVFGSGWLDNRYEEVIGRDKIDVKRENFEHSKSYIKGMADDLAKWKYELTTEESETARKALIELIVHRTANLDVELLEDETLRQFVKDIRNGEYK